MVITNHDYNEHFLMVPECLLSPSSTVYGILHQNEKFRISENMTKLSRTKCIFCVRVRVILRPKMCVFGLKMRSMIALFQIVCIYGIYCVKIEFLFSQKTHSDLNSDSTIRVWTSLMYSWLM